jgi:23S rRNA (cytosine1962-C5)-methyltransferase
MPANSAGPYVVIVSRRGADRIRAGHVWVYRSDVIEAEAVPPGALVTVQEVGGRPPHPRTLGSAFYSTASEIAIRLISPKPTDNVHQLVRERVRSAIAYRERFVEDTNAYRVVFSEGDFLPGLIADRYNDVLSFQVLTQAMDSPEMRETLVAELRRAFDPAIMVERVDARVRQLEQLPERENEVVFLDARRRGGAPDSRQSHGGAAGAPDRQRQGSALRTEFSMNGVRFLFDPLAGQKTGAFLDQRENYAAAAGYARGEALDVFSYQGGFALHLARVSDKVTGIDSSRPALEAAEQNAKLNGREIEWIEANAFDLLRDYSDAGRHYDTIVLDPPAFAKSRRDAPAALRAYKELNLRALKMLRPGGILVTCSCSYHVSTSDLLEAVMSASVDSHRNLRLLENRGQSKDHPSVLGIPETAYLKCLILLTS